MATLAFTGAVQRTEDPDQFVDVIQFAPSLAVDFDSIESVVVEASSSYEVPLADMATVVIMYSSAPVEVTYESASSNTAGIFTSKYLMMFNADITSLSISNPSNTTNTTVRIVVGG
jgi:hypothetical protein